MSKAMKWFLAGVISGAACALLAGLAINNPQQGLYQASAVFFGLLAMLTLCIAAAAAEQK